MVGLVAEADAAVAAPATSHFLHVLLASWGHHLPVASVVAAQQAAAAGLVALVAATFEQKTRKLLAGHATFVS